MPTCEYIYLGTKQTDPKLKGRECYAVRNAQGKCIKGRGKKGQAGGGNMLVCFPGFGNVIVIGRMLRKIREA